jgi:osmoprotectant transport system ATP-binding protein
LLTIENLSKSFGATQAVAEATLTVAAGETLVLAGTSGSGKTTLLKMINRLVEPDTGRILLHGTDLRQRDPVAVRRQIGYVIQQAGLFPHYTVRQNVLVVPRLRQQPLAAVLPRVERLLHRLGLPPEEFLDRYPHELSGGQQQRIGIARALAAEPDLVLMDEPFSALDPITRSALVHDLGHLSQWAERTVIIVSHDVQEAFRLGDRICLMHEGRIQQLGTPRELLLSPANAYVRRFLGENYLSLAMHVYSLAELCGELPQGTASAEDLTFSADEPVFTAVNELFKSENGRGAFPWEGQSYVFQVADLLAALNERLRDS